MQQDTFSPSFSPRNVFLMPRSFHRAGDEHWFWQCSVKFSELNGASVVFVRQPSSISPVSSWPPWLLPPLCSLPIHAPLSPLAGRERRCRAVPSTPASSATPAAFRLGHQKSSASICANQHRPSHPNAPRGRPLFCDHRSTVAVAWNQRTCSLPPVYPRTPFRRIPLIQTKSNRA